jgi:putative endopeptidase
VKLRGQYQDYVAKLFSLAGDTVAASADAAQDVLKIETELASQALPPEDLQDPTKLYHAVDGAALQGMTPSFNWAKYFNFINIKEPTTIDVTEPKFMAQVETLLKTADLKSLKNYLKWHVIQALAPYLGKDVYDAYFAFNGVILNGLKTPAPRWKKCVNVVSDSMGEALGQAFVAKTFSANAKQKALKLIDDLRTSFKQDLTTLPWLDAPTRQAALAKLDLMSQKIGYPDHWRDYRSLSITRKALWQNVFRSTIFESHRNFNKIGGKVDPSEWGMTPQTVNAYYDPSLNQINFPAGILQAPFFSEDAEDASNYGAIGMVIGHEMTHGFDTTGSKFDGHGAQLDWWTPEVKSLFDSKAQCLMDQYSSYSPLPTVKVNGKLTVTENIADQGGLKLAFSAFSLASQGKPPGPAIGGLNDTQQFFVSMAQMWCEKQSDESLKRQVTSNPHSPAKFRVIGTVVNSPDFAKAFSCSQGQPMAPANRCSIKFEKAGENNIDFRR